MTELSPREWARYRNLLEARAERLKNQAAIIRNGGDEKRAGDLDDEAFAITRLLFSITQLLAENADLRLKLDPAIEGPRQMIDALTGGRV